LYDSSGNLLQYHDEGGAPVYHSFFYDDTNLAPVREIKNSTYAAYNYAISVNQNRKTLSNAQITDYVYDPRFGLTSVTTPNGVTTTKEYDVFGRLKCIKDNNGKILQTMEYNFNVQ
jgi:YD repeat-containing protein